ncbi:hypothetical protein [Ferrimonas marina]|uniref:Uncharacterized protein n=1 Tax=Ferrimonas marina TaxID=299255 RepID=A0A1M5NH06_9GAMM|nr:hypothetical protein [Ferrimonas marina]SHG88866.1 hypothetical protein SAMN02745129_1054 [Ferrimonas marina]
MKEFVAVHTYLMEPYEVGEWEGQEALAAENINRLYHAVYDMADNDIDVALLEQMLESVWPTWQFNPQLLELDDDMLDAFVEALFTHFDPKQGQEDF